MTLSKTQTVCGGRPVKKHADYWFTACLQVGNRRNRKVSKIQTVNLICDFPLFTLTTSLVHSHLSNSQQVQSFHEQQNHDTQTAPPPSSPGQVRLSTVERTDVTTIQQRTNPTVQNSLLSLSACNRGQGMSKRGKEINWSFITLIKHTNSPLFPDRTYNTSCWYPSCTWDLPHKLCENNNTATRHTPLSDTAIVARTANNSGLSAAVNQRYAWPAIWEIKGSGTNN